MAKWQSQIPQIDGVQVIHAPVFKNEDYSPEMMARCASPLSVRALHIDSFRPRKYKLYSTNKTEVRRC